VARRAQAVHHPVTNAMCLIIQKPAGRSVTAEFLRNAWQDNPDGWGLFHLHDGRPAHARGMGLEALLEHNARLPLHSEVYLHLRKATYGGVCATLVHPHPVRDSLLLMHNGSIDHLAPCDPTRSDTVELAHALRDLLAGLSDEQAARLLRSQGWARLIAPLIDGSSIVLLDAWGSVRLGRAWHRVDASRWDASMVGIEVSNLKHWQPQGLVAVAG
jgi:predicted glutamine amidotransferase